MLHALIGAISLGALCLLWALWQRLADRLDSEARSDSRVGGRCCVPGRAGRAEPHR